MTQRFVFEQEVDKKAKALMVDSIQFRNSFDTEGPLIPGLSCEDAMEKLGLYNVCVCVCVHACYYIITDCQSSNCYNSNVHSTRPTPLVPSTIFLLQSPLELSILMHMYVRIFPPYRGVYDVVLGTC